MKVVDVPAVFRHELMLSAESPALFGSQIQPWQQRDFDALDPAWLRLAGRDRVNDLVQSRRSREGEAPAEPVSTWATRSASRVGTRGASPPPCAERPAVCQRAYIERPRGHAKTSDIAVAIAWILLFARSRVQGIAAAADRDQANLVWEAVRQIARLNGELCAGLVFQKHLIVNPRTGSRLEVISSDVASSWGALPDFVICDELCHWEKPDLWHSLFSSAAKRPHCVLAVLTNAGVGRGWQWEVREAARTSPNWYFSSLAGPQAPWITPEHLAEQRRLLPRPVFERLWLNAWQHSDGEFVTLEEAEACRDESLTIQSHGRPGCRYIAAVDYAEKHDHTIGVVLHREGPRLIVDRMDVAVPLPGRPVMVSWVEDWMQRIAAGFHDVTFVLDEYQLLGTIQKFEHALPIERFQFAAGQGNHALAITLRKLIIHRELAWYPGCGEIHTQGAVPASVQPRNDLETELASLVLKQSPTGRLRIDHLPDQIHHDDRSFALGAACLYAVHNPGAGEWLSVGEFEL